MAILPPLYAGWSEKILPGKIPSESKATCDQCAMCDHTQERPGSNAFFDPHAKCCTYLPELPNFLVGGVLADDPAAVEGRASVEARLEAKIEVTPFGLGKSPVYSLLYDHATEAFGRNRTLLCPHYIDEDGGRCGIWRHRNAVCVTWFCKHDRGAIGMKFWRTLLLLLSQVEKGLSRWCVLELEIGIRALERLFLLFPDPRERPKLNGPQMDQVADLESYRLLWGRWLGREREFYQRCARLVGGLSWDDVTRICGPDVLALTKLVQDAYDQLTSNQVPEVVRLRQIQIVGMTLDSVQVKTYSPHDLLKFPRKLLDVLPYLDNQPVSEALQTIEKEKGLRLSMDLVRRLVDFEILTTGPEEEPPS
jgi:hypothetical protein